MSMTRAYSTLTLVLAIPLPRASTSFSLSFLNCSLHSRCLRPRFPAMSTSSKRVLLSGAGAAAAVRGNGGNSGVYCGGIYGHGPQPLSRGLRRRRSSTSSCLVTASPTEAADPVQADEGEPRAALGTTQPPLKRGSTRKRLTSTGGLKSLPIVTPSVELLAHATSRSKKVSQDMSMKNSRNRARKWTAERMDMLGKAVSKPLRDITRRYKLQLPILHPFEATLADLTVRAREKSGERTLQSVLDDVNEFRKIALEISKAAAQEGKRGERKLDIMQTMDNGYARMEEHFMANGKVIEDLTAVQKALRGLPIVQLHLPTVVLVGAPNVGKSSIVRAVSTGTPEVNSYPFTTRGMSLGHMFHPKTNARYQIMDTPGVLSRPDGERNEMEALTLASMQHLPTAVVFVMDLSGYSGLQSSLENQIDVRHELRRRFPKRPWLDVVSKADLPRIGLEEAKPALPDGYLDLSTEDGTGIEELKERLFGMYEIIERILEPPPDMTGLPAR